MRALRQSLTTCLLFASGCGGFVAEMPTWVGFDEDSDEAILLLAVTPPASVGLAVGRIERDGWRGKGPKSRTELSAKNGFVVAKVAPTQDDHAYALVEARPENCKILGAEASSTYATAFWSAATAEPARGCPTYAPSGEAHLPVFRATAGRVTFVGGIRLGATKDPELDAPPAKIAVIPVSPDDMEAARRFMAQHYPKVTARVVPRPLEMLRVK